jgi:peptidylprolyl isomerase/FKBP-type peptidyl-prolyl cis-trans isomerase FklB
MRRRSFLAASSVLLLLAACDRKPKAPPIPTPDELEKSAAAAKTWMEENAKKPGIMTLPSGVQYKITKTGPAGGVSPKEEDEVRVNYEGGLTDGQVFDSSYQRGTPEVFRLGGLIAAWVEALQQMKPGDEWMLYVPPEQGYGVEGSPPKIPPNSVLVFKIELLGVLPAGSPIPQGKG